MPRVCLRGLPERLGFQTSVPFQPQSRLQASREPPQGLTAEWSPPVAQELEPTQGGFELTSETAPRSSCPGARLRGQLRPR
eukprot:2305904-Alexandrium_andersonii.AAC.1